MADVAPVETTTTTRKTAGRKPGVRKTASAKKEAPKAKESVQKLFKGFKAPSFEKLGDTAKEVAYAQLGVYGRVYDEVNDRVSQARKDAPKRWDALVKRGEKVQRDIEKAQKDLRSDIEKRQKELRDDLKERFGDIDLKGDLEARVEKVREAVEKLTKRVRSAA